MRAHRAVFVLALAQATAMICNSIMIVTSGLTGERLAEYKGWATLPLAFQFIATMLTTFPASFLMKRVGRKRGFMLGACIGIAGGLIMAGGTYVASFWLFAFGNTIFGISAAFTLFYRFAAAEAADDAFRPKAISLVMAGGVISASPRTGTRQARPGDLPAASLLYIRARNAGGECTVAHAGSVRSYLGRGFPGAASPTEAG